MGYSARSDIEDRFGVNNVAKWADLDNDEDATKITNRIARAIVVADAEIDDTLRGSPYDVPFASHTTIVEISATLAGIWLYDARGVADFDAAANKAQHRLHHQRTEARDKLGRLRSGALRLNADYTEMVPLVVPTD